MLSSSAGLVTSLSVERADPIKALIRSAPSRLDAITPHRPTAPSHDHYPPLTAA